MNRHRRAVVLAAVSVASLFLSTAGANAENAGSGPYLDFLTASSIVLAAPSSVADSAADDCNLQISDRLGSWVCFTDDTAQTITGASLAANMTGATGMPSSSQGLCNVAGCYYRYDDFHVDFQSVAGSWGYGPTVLGTMYVYVNWQLIGAQTISKPVQWSTSRNTNTIVFTGDLLNAAAGAAGTEVPGKLGLYPLSSATAGVLYSWIPNGYKSYDNTMWDHSQVAQFSWSLAGYPGYWYCFVKSVSAHTSALGTGAIYRFRTDLGLPSAPYGGGWHA